MAGGLARFLEVGQALAELRNRRLYRTEFASFEAYISTCFGMRRSAIDGLIRSAQTAQVLLDAGVSLPPDVTPSALRPLSAMQTEALQVACWQLVQTISPARAPTGPLISKLCRLIRNCLDDTQSEETLQAEEEELESASEGKRANNRIKDPLDPTRPVW